MDVSASTWDEIMKLRACLAKQTSVVPTVLEGSGWHFKRGVLCHQRAEFFKIVGFVDESGSERLLIRQRETALVGLLVCRSTRERSFLLNARCEPGLHGLCQFSTSIQSTPSNYERRHGGDPTPFITYFTKGVAGTETLHDSLEYDWGKYYDVKRKRFAIIDVPEPMPVDPPLLWVSERELMKMLVKPFLVTMDLRVAIAFLLVHDCGVELPAPKRHTEGLGAKISMREIPLEAMTNWRIDPRGITEVTGSQGVDVKYVTTQSTSREVKHWGQPLVRIARPNTVTLWVRGAGVDREFALERRTEIGLDGISLYFPAVLEENVSNLVRKVVTSAEGGRFLRHRVVLQLADATRLSSTHVEQVIWLDIEALSALLLIPEATSVELRAVASLALAENV